MRLMKALAAESRGHERGQILIIFAVMMSFVFILAAISVDYSWWLSDRRGVARAADLSALAAVQDLPADPANHEYNTLTAGCAAVPSCAAAFEWAENNSYGESDDVTITVKYWCSNTIPVAVDAACFNERWDEDELPITSCPNSGGEENCDTINVIVEQDSRMIFSNFFNMASFDIGASGWAKVEFQIAPLDSALSIDASGSMGGSEAGCTGPPFDNDGCAIHEAREASKLFASLLIGPDPDEGESQVGYAPYNTCYSNDGSGNCVPSIDLTPAECANPGAESWVLCLGRDVDLLRERIDMTVHGNSTNVCLGLYRSGEILNGPGRNTDPDIQRFVVILTDGANVYSAHPSVPAACTPEGSGGCGSGATGDQSERLDLCTLEVADDLKAQGIEIYVVGLYVGGGHNSGNPSDPGFCNGIGNSGSERRLLKCVASSSPGTNDRYFETNDPETLGNIFVGIVYDVGRRGLTPGD